MPLVATQSIVSVFIPHNTTDAVDVVLKRELEKYPPVKIVTMNVTPIPGPLGNSMVGYHVTVVVEVVPPRPVG